MKEKNNENKPKKEETGEEKPITSLEMTNEQMMNYLYQLSKTHYWQAIIKLNRLKDSEILAAISTMDPVRQPTDMARNQGMRNGIYLIENMAEIERKRIEDKKKDQEDKNLPNYGGY